MRLSSLLARPGRPLAALLALVVATTLLLACGKTPDNVVRVYSSIPLQGASGADNLTIVHAIRMALDKHNGRAGALKVEYISLDDSTKSRGKWDAATEQANARRAAADPLAVAYIGTVNSGAAKVSIPILNRVQLAMISPANTYPGLTKSNGALSSEPYIYYPLGPNSRNYCRVLPSDDLQGAAGALYAKQLGAKSIYVLDDTELYGHGVASVFAAKAAEIGLKVLGGPEGIETREGDPQKGGDPRFSAARKSTAQTVAAAKPDVVYFGGATENHPGELLQFLRQAQFNGPFLGPDGIAEPAFVQEATANGAKAGTVYATLPGASAEQLTGAGAAWLKDYKARFPNDNIAQYTHYGYETMTVVLDAIAKAGKRDRAAVLATLRAEKNVPGSILDPWSFDGNCDTSLRAISVQALDNNSKFTFKELAPAP